MKNSQIKSNSLPRSVCFASDVITSAFVLHYALREWGDYSDEDYAPEIAMFTSLFYNGYRMLNSVYPNLPQFAAEVPNNHLVSTLRLMASAACLLYEHDKYNNMLPHIIGGAIMFFGCFKYVIERAPNPVRIGEIQ